MANEIETPDPVAAKAAKYALEVTDTSTSHPIWNRVVVLLSIIFIIVGTFGAIIGIINTIDVRHQNGQLRQQQACSTQLLKAITEEQSARAKITGDDRTALNTLVASIGKAKTKADTEKAIVTFQKQSKINDQKRANYPVPTFSTDICSTQAGQSSVSSTMNSPSATPSHSNKTSSSSKSPGFTSTSTVGSSAAHNSVGPTQTPGPKKPATSQSAHRANGAGANSAPHTVTKTASAVAAPRSPGLLNIPGCTISVLGAHVC